MLLCFISPNRPSHEDILLLPVKLRSTYFVILGANLGAMTRPGTAINCRQREKIGSVFILKGAICLVPLQVVTATDHLIKFAISILRKFF